MQSLFPFFILVLFLGGIPSTPNNQLQNSPSDSIERIDWLRKMLSARAGYIKRFREGSIVRNTLENVSLDACTLSYTDALRSEVNRKIIEEQLFLFTVPLRDIDTARIKVERQEDITKVTLLTNEDKSTIKGIARSTKQSVYGPFSSEESAFQSSVVINFEADMLAQQIVTNLKEVISSCRRAH